MVVPCNGEEPWLSQPLFPRAGDCPPPRSLARGEDETGDPLPNAKPPTVDDSVTAFLRTLSGANTRRSTITASRTDRSRFARFLAETGCTVAMPADVTRTDVSEFLGLRPDSRLSGVTRRQAGCPARVVPLSRGRSPHHQEPDYGVADTDAERLALPDGSDRCGDHDGHRRHL